MSQRKTIDFLGVRNYAMGLSIFLTVAALVLLGVRGLNFGLDFTGGTLVEISYTQAVPLSEVREALETAGYDRATVVNYGTDTEVLVRLPQANTAGLGDQVVKALHDSAGSGQVKLNRVEFVGPQVGEELREMGGIAMILALIMVMVYVGTRFELKLAVGAVVALFHDVIVALGFFALFQWDFDLNVFAAVLAIIGYSINDSIVVFDRVRENFRKLRKTDVVDLLNISITETLDRTLATSGITLVVLLSLLIFGGEVLWGMAIALIIGTVVGTFSSIYVASPISLWLGLKREDLMVTVKEGAGAKVDDLP